MRVSILIPVYNTAAFLPLCLDSIIAQTHRDLQIVLINDGSSDNSQAIAEQYAARDSRVEVYHQENAGVATARNHLLRHVRGDYVLFVDSDDWIEPDMVEFLLGNMQEHGADIVTCAMVSNDSPVTHHLHLEIWDQQKAIEKFLFHKELSGSLWNKLVRTSLLHNLVFDTRISYGEDALFCWQVLQRLQTLVQTNRQLYHYRVNENSISHQKWTPEKKGTGHLVWSAICRDVAEHYPQYIDIAHARFALEDMWALFFASLSGCPFDQHIRERQLNIKRHIPSLRKHKIDGYSKYAVAVALAYWYGFGRIIKLLKG